MNRALLVSGINGVGKSTVAARVSERLGAAGARTAFVDVDTVAQFGPPPWRHRGGLSFYDSLKCQNVGSLWQNYRNAGATHLVIAAQIDDRQLRVKYESALGDCRLQVVLLTAPSALLKQRLLGRERDPFHPRTYDPDGTLRANVLERVATEQACLQAAGVHDFAVVNHGSPDATAEQILELAEWLPFTAAR